MAYYLGREAFLKSVFFAFAHELLMEMNSWQIKSPCYLEGGGGGGKKRCLQLQVKICLHFFKEWLFSLLLYTNLGSVPINYICPLGLICIEKRMTEKPTILDDLVALYFYFHNCLNMALYCRVDES